MIMGINGRNNGRKVYYLAPGSRLLSMDDDRTRDDHPGESLGPLGADMPAQEPELRAGYSARKGRAPQAATPRGFFLDRYVY